jgi:ligand-binding sensor domain-containing protein
VIATEKGIYEYNSQNDQFEKSAYFKDIFGNSSIRYLKDDPNGNIWFIDEKKKLGVVDFSAVTSKTIYLPELNGKMISGFEHIYPCKRQQYFCRSRKRFLSYQFRKV